MAIYSCNLKSVGRTTHAPGTAGAYLRYISRPDAEPVLLAGHIPLDPIEARTWMDGRERAMRKNGRVIDKIRLAIPRELQPDERSALIEDFMKDLAGGRVPWYAAIHQTGKDAHNPHAHVAVHDRSIDSGRRLLRLSDNARDRIKAGLPGPKAVDWVRERWEVMANHALERAGHEVRIDRRALEAQGIDRAPTIHEGPGARHIHANIRRPDSRQRVNGCGRVIDYPMIDAGRLRREFNAEIIDLNLARAARAGNPVAAAWADYEKEQFARDSRLEEQLVAASRQRMNERRTVSRRYTQERDRLRAEARFEALKVSAGIQAKFMDRRQVLRLRQKQERDALRDKHARLLARLARNLSRMVKERQGAERQRQIDRHRHERSQLAREYRAEREAAKAQIKARYGPQIARVARQRTDHLARLRGEHRQAAKGDDAIRQEREAEREYARRKLEEKLKSMPNEASRESSPQHSDALKRALEQAQRQEEARGERGKGGGRSRT